MHGDPSIRDDQLIFPLHGFLRQGIQDEGRKDKTKMNNTVPITSHAREFRHLRRSEVQGIKIVHVL